MSTNVAEEQFALLAMAPADRLGEVFVLSSFYYEPLDPSEVTSIVYRVIMEGDRFRGEMVYEVDEWLTTLAAGEGGGLAVAGMTNHLHMLRGSRWTTKTIPITQGIRSIVWSDKGTMLLFGRKGEIARAGSSISIDKVADGVQLSASIRSRSKIYAVGDMGRFLEFADGNWKLVDVPTNANLLGIDVSSDNVIFTCGGRGTVMKGDSGGWRLLEAPSITFSSVATFEGKTYLAGGNAGVFVVEGNSVVKLNDLVLRYFLPMEDRMIAIGDELFAWFDGKNWFGGPFFAGAN